MVCKNYRSCEMPSQWEQFSLAYIKNSFSIWCFIQIVHIGIFMSLHGPAETCIVVVSMSPFHALWCTHTTYIHAHDQKQSLNTPAGRLCQPAVV